MRNSTFVEQTPPPSMKMFSCNRNYIRQWCFVWKTGSVEFSKWRRSKFYIIPLCSETVVRAVSNISILQCCILCERDGCGAVYYVPGELPRCYIINDVARTSKNSKINKSGILYEVSVTAERLILYHCRTNILSIESDIVNIATDEMTSTAHICLFLR